MVLADHPHRPDVRGEFAGLVVDRGRVAEDTPVREGRVHREVRVERAPQDQPPVQREQHPAQPAPPHQPPPAQPGTLHGGDAMQGVEGVRGPGQQRERRPRDVRAGPVPGRPVRAQVPGRPPVELGARRRRYPVGLAQDEQVVVRHVVVEEAAPPLQLRPLPDEPEQPLVLGEHLEVLPARRAHRVALAALAVGHADPVDERDRAGRPQRLVDDHRVLVEAGGEGEAALAEEVEAVRLVPHDREQVEQFGAFGDGEDLRAGRAEHLRVPVALHRAVPVGARVVEQHDVGAVGGVDALGDRPQRARCVAVVAVQEEQVLAPRQPRAVVAGRADTAVDRQMHRHHPLVAGRELVDDRRTPVRGAVVDDDHLEVAVRLVEDRLQTGAQVALHVVDGHDDAEAGHGTSRSGNLLGRGST